MAPVTKTKKPLGRHYLKEWREHRDLSQQFAADRIDVSRELLSKIENMKSPYLQPQLEGLAALYRETPATLLARNPIEPEPSVTSEMEIRRFIARISDLTEQDVDVVMTVIGNARAVRRAGSSQAGTGDQSKPATLPHARVPSR